MMSAVLGIAPAWSGALAQQRTDTSEIQPIMDYESVQALRNRLQARVLFIEVRPEPGQYQDPDLMPSRTGEGAAVVIDGIPRIVTSWFLVQGARRISVLKPDAGSRGATVQPMADVSRAASASDSIDVEVVRQLPDAGLTVLTMPPEIERSLAFPPQAPGILAGPDANRRFWCVTPVTPGVSVLSDTAIVDRAGPPLERLFLAAGSLFPGTVLFDSEGIPVAVAARESFSGSKFSLVAPLSGALPDKPAKPRVQAPEPGGSAPAGIWIDRSPDRESEDEGQ